MSVEVYTADGRQKNKGQSWAPQGVVFGAYRSAALSLAASADVVLDTKEFDPFNWFDVSTGRFTPKVAGYYEISGAVSLGALFSVQAAIVRNGSLVKSGAWAAITPTSVNTESVVTALVYLNGSTDYVNLRVWHSNGATATALNPGSSNTYLAGELVATTVGVAPEPWSTPTLLNGWANLTGGYEPASYMKDPHGFVHLRGQLVAPAAITAFVLPVGYRPAAQFDEFATNYWNGTAYVAGVIQVRGTSAAAGPGNVNIYNNAGSTPVSTNQYTLNGITFRAES